MTSQPLLSGLRLPPVDLPAPAAHDLRHWPNLTSAAVCHHAKQLGAAGEALFDAQTLCFGELSLAVGEFFPFDRLILRAPRPLRVQVKTVTLPSPRGYSVEPRKGYRGSPQGMRRYEDDDFDLLAIVILRESVIAYTADMAPRHHVPLSAITHLRRDPRASFDAALAAIEEAALGSTLPAAPSISAEA
ncbi:hypothetical protein [Szabonella alba]|uniref:PD(D/E)XK endonuclease domain-containing protein n=1 Tax=Szabonella alba TaxID=2804194 RepID=A0A8K0VE10_9RHOB|nr:hypothetical protein [Szabonella alba]MBL4917592.1 hypothetical protein [Szabonella alba]